VTTKSIDPSVSRPDWLPDDEYPFRLRTLDVGGVSVAYVDEGHGPTVLFVHTGMWSFIFRDVITRLKGEFRCVTLDFPGYGLSPEPPGGELGLADQSELLGDFVARLGLTDITMVLHDLGGPVGSGFAAAHPDLVNGLVMANTFTWKPEGKALIRMLRIVSSKPVTVLDRATKLIPRITTTRFGVGLHLTKNGKRAFMGPFSLPGRVRRFHTLMRDALREVDLYEHIERATAGPLEDKPVLTIFGEKNDPFGFQRRHAATFANHRGVVFAKGNHFPMLDDPDLFAGTLRAWWYDAMSTQSSGGKA